MFTRRKENRACLVPTAVLLLVLLRLGVLAYGVVAQGVDHEGVGVQVHLVAGGGNRGGNLCINVYDVITVTLNEIF